MQLLRLTVIAGRLPRRLTAAVGAVDDDPSLSLSSKPPEPVRTRICERHITQNFRRHHTNYV